LKQCDRQFEAKYRKLVVFSVEAQRWSRAQTRTMEKTMIRMAGLVLLMALFSFVSFVAVAQLTKGNSSTAPGQLGAGMAPGQQQTAPDDAKTFAPGQQ